MAIAATARERAAWYLAAAHAVMVWEPFRGEDPHKLIPQALKVPAPPPRKLSPEERAFYLDLGAKTLDAYFTQQRGRG